MISCEILATSYRREKDDKRRLVKSNEINYRGQ